MRGGFVAVLVATGALLVSGAASVPAPAAAGEQPVAISAGSDHTCALTTSHAVKCWGVDGADYTDTGDCCDLSNTPVPQTIQGLESGVDSMTAGGDHGCALVGGAGKCWGWTDAYQLGNPDAQDICDSEFFCAEAVDVTGLPNPASFATGGAHSCAVTTTGGAECWGSNSFGELGIGLNGGYEDQPVPVSGLSSGVASIAAGLLHTCALLTSGDVDCWGANDRGQLGDGTTTERDVPTPVPGLHNVVELTAGSEHTCALLTGGTVKCWGANGNGQLGDGTKTDRHAPTSVTGLTGTPSTITAGGNHTCVLSAGGAVECWGANKHGQLGDGTTTDSSSPITVAGVAPASAVSAGDFHTCALQAGGSIDCWGGNDNGQLGDGTNVDRHSPTPVLWGPVCKVPSVSRKTLTDAEAALTAGGCTTGTVYRAYSARISSGNVVGSYPEARHYLPLNGPVDLLVSKGRRPASSFRHPRGNSLRAKADQGQLAADGKTVAFPVYNRHTACYSIRIWRVGRGAANVKSPCDESGVYTFGLAGTRVLWPTYDSANLIYCHLLTATLARPRPTEIPFCTDEGDDPDVENVYGHGSLLAFNADLDVYATNGKSRPRLVAQGVTATSVSNGRVSVLEPDGTVAVCRPDGSVVNRLGTGVIGAKLAGDTLYAQSGATVTPYDVSTGSAGAARALKGGPFASLSDVAHGIAVYQLLNEVHLVRLSSGKDVALKATGAAIESKGLFYSTGKRVVFVPMRSLKHLLK